MTWFRCWWNRHPMLPAVTVSEAIQCPGGVIVVASRSCSCGHRTESTVGADLSP